MKKVLVTGYDGFLGKALTLRLLNKGYMVYGLSRHASFSAENLTPLRGDILQSNLGIAETHRDIHAVHHLAAIHKLGEDRDGSMWQTNVQGTENVIDFCLKNKINHLYFTSSAYTQGRNIYERSKVLGETMVKGSGIPTVTIFKPSIIMGNDQQFYPGHFSQFVTLVIKVHQRAELVRRKVEGMLRLPVIEPVFRIRANPEGELNLVSQDDVVEAMTSIKRGGTFWLTHPSPPTLSQLFDWIGEFVMIRIKIESSFKPTPIETAFEKMSTAFIPYLWGDTFPSDLKYCPPITKEFIGDTIKSTIIA